MIGRRSPDGSTKFLKIGQRLMATIYLGRLQLLSQSSICHPSAMEHHVVAQHMRLDRIRRQRKLIVVIACVIATVEEEEAIVHKRKRRSSWVKPWLQQRPLLGNYDQ